MARGNRIREPRGRMRGWSRREVLAGTTAAGLTAGLPGWLIGCGADDGDGARHPPPPTPTATPLPEGPREDCTLQFDLSFGDLDNPCLHVFNSDDDGVRLQPHTDESRAHFRNENPVLADVPDEHLTHFLEDVDLPADALQLFWMTGTVRDSDEDALAGFNIHVPTAVLAAMAQSAPARGRRLVRTAKMRFYNIGVGRSEAELVGDYPAVASFVTPVDTAAALVFQMPEILNLNLEQGTSILELIQTLPCTGDDPDCLPFLDTLASRIARGWPATVSGFTMFNGQQVPAWAKL